MSGREKPIGSLGLTGAMPRQKSEDEQKIEKILREEQEKEHALYAMTRGGPGRAAERLNSLADEVIRLRMLEQKRKSLSDLNADRRKPLK